MQFSTKNLMKNGHGCIRIQSNELLRVAINDWMKYKGTGNWHLVFQLKDDWKVVQFKKLNALANRLGPDLLDIIVSEIPVDFITVNVFSKEELVDVDIDELAFDSPGELIVILDQNEFIGIVFVGNQRSESDLFAGPATQELLGIFVDLTEDKRVKYNPSIDMPVCPACGNAGYKRFDIQTRLFYCRHCGKSTD